MTTICNHCGKELSPHDSHDPRVMRPVHKACYSVRIALRAGPMSGPVRDLPMDVKNTLRGGR